MDTPLRIYVVDDEPDVRDAVGVFLERRGYEVRTCADGAELRARWAADGPAALVVLDISMPGEDGHSLTRWLRQTADPGLGILMLTAAVDTVDRVVGLELGADDYLAKPFDLHEVLARVRAILRRAGAQRPQAQPQVQRLPVGPHRLDTATRELIAADGTQIELSAMEFDMLEVFARHPNQVLSRDRLLDLAHNRRWDPYDRSIDVRINRLRRKIEADPANPTILRTVRGAGYMLIDRHGTGAGGDTTGSAN